MATFLIVLLYVLPILESMIGLQDQEGEEEVEIGFESLITLLVWPVVIGMLVVEYTLGAYILPTVEKFRKKNSNDEKDSSNQ